jgi:hypothetical protein
LVAGDQNLQEPEIKRPFGVTDIGVNNPDIARAAYGQGAQAWPGGKDLAWPKDIAGLRALGLAGAEGGNAEQAVFTKTPSPAYSDNSNQLTLAKPGGTSVEAAYAQREQMLASAGGSGTALKPIPDLAGIRRTSEASLPLNSRFHTA